MPFPVGAGLKGRPVVVVNAFLRPCRKEFRYKPYKPCRVVGSSRWRLSSVVGHAATLYWSLLHALLCRSSGKPARHKPFLPCTGAPITKLKVSQPETRGSGFAVTVRPRRSPRRANVPSLPRELCSVDNYLSRYRDRVRRWLEIPYDERINTISSARGCKVSM